MKSLFAALLPALLAAKLTMRINKQLSLVETVAEEMYTVSATNGHDYNLKRLTFSLTPQLFPYLTSLRLFEGTTVVATLTEFPENRFSLNFTAPKRPGETFGFKVIANYLKPFVFVPYKLRVNEDQKIEFSDSVLNLVFEDATDIEKVYGKYVLPSQVHSYSKDLIQSESRNSQGNKELILNDVLPPFGNKVFKCHYTFDRPLETLTSATKTLEVSMWGNLGLSYDFRMVNEAAELDGELSNIDYQAHMHSSGRNSLRQSRVMLPRDAWRISLSDEVGNLTRATAKFSGDDEIEVSIVPRFSLFGGWKSTFWLSHNQHSKKSLTRAKENGNIYRIETSLTHPLGYLLTKDYKFAICLPEFATFLGFEGLAPGPHQETYTSQGLFELKGKQCHLFQLYNVHEKTHKRQVAIIFSYSTTALYVRLVYVVSVVTLLFLAFFAASRVDLDFKSRPEKVKED